MQGFCDWKGAEYCRKLRQFLEENAEWMQLMVQKHSGTDPLWYQVKIF